MNQSPADSKWLSFTVSVSVFLFFAMMLSVPRGYTAGAVLLLFSSLYFFAKRPRLELNREDKILACLLIAVFLAAVLSFVYHGNRSRSMDLPSRYLLAVPILILLAHVPPRLSWLWAGFVAGCVSGAGIAYWQTHLQDIERSAGFTGVIQFGDIALLMGVFCVAGLFWAGTQGRNAFAWRVVLIVGAIAGGYASLASGSRGGWIALPVIVVLFYATLIDKKTIKRALAAAAVVCIGLAVVATTSPDVERRYDEAVSDIRLYQQGNADSSIGARFAIWQAVSQMIQQKPLLGWSEIDYRAGLERLAAENRADPVALRLANTHNGYLELWVFQGLAGLVPVIALLIASFWYFCRRLRSANTHVRTLALCGAILSSSYGIFSMSQVMLGRNNTLLFFVISLVVLWACMRKIERTSSSIRSHIPHTPD